MADKHWIESAIEHHGAFSAAAKKAGKSTEEFAKEHEHSDGIMGHRARLAMTLMHLHKHDNKTPKEYSTEDMPKD